MRETTAPIVNKTVSHILVALSIGHCMNDMGEAISDLHLAWRALHLLF
ncbi:hypothetical protein [Parabacteroides chinchillae]|uniref:Uncharacterized protein n=1 Tax=Parabacteroides chinchillae TaxID=871327 RepID=A0A8G2BTZ1_9BACT|nr:hypothetical protein [Parabacteroides chinchillae]SEF46854.1 hypothetical protein SAMN05444001_101312 [Parabacteroides chinchillae]